MSSIKKVMEYLMGKAIRRIPQTPDSKASIYLSFDDGPAPSCTPEVLDLLKKHGAKATFFLIAEKAKAHPALVQRILSEGHAIGNHSLDHRYRVFFQAYTKMETWILNAEEELKKAGVQESVGFRPPVGIRTPKLAKALRHLKIPLILWQQRCYDGIFSFNVTKAQRLCSKIQAGDIILLHDKQDTGKNEFLSGLKLLLESCKENFELSKIPSLSKEQH